MDVRRPGVGRRVGTDGRGLRVVLSGEGVGAEEVGIGKADADDGFVVRVLFKGSEVDARGRGDSEMVVVRCRVAAGFGGEGEVVSRLETGNGEGDKGAISGVVGGDGVV